VLLALPTRALRPEDRVAHLIRDEVERRHGRGPVEAAKNR
jgi:hypothetical protein